MAETGLILQVEDSEEDVYLLKYAFNRAGITNPVEVVIDGQQAIDYLSGVGTYSDRRRFPLPILSLLDLQLPYHKGLEVLQWIRNQPSLDWLIVLVLSSSIYRGDVQRAYKLGANAFLVKPSSPDVLTDMCKAIKHFWLGHNLPPIQSLPEY